MVFTLAAPVVSYGNEQAEVASVSVSGTSGTPTGTVTVASANGSVFCTATLFGGQGSCVPVATWAYPGQFTVTASYSGDANFAPSVSPPQTATVTKDPTRTTLSLSRSTVIYGDERSVEVTSVVIPEYSDGQVTFGPSGVIKIVTGITTFCYIPYYSPVCSFPLGPTNLPAGVAKISAAYSGNNAFDPSAAPVKMLTVTKATSQTTLTLSASKITYGHENSERLTVKASPQYAGTPTGMVTISRGTQVVCKIALSAGMGSCMLTAKELPVGVSRLIAHYPGNLDFTGSASASKTLTIVK